VKKERFAGWRKYFRAALALRRPRPSTGRSLRLPVRRILRSTRAPGRRPVHIRARRSAARRAAPSSDGSGSSDGPDDGPPNLNKPSHSGITAGALS
jgi:hypothetical protein